MRYLARILIVLGFLSLLVSVLACGGDDDADATPVSTATTAAGETAVPNTPSATTGTAATEFFDIAAATTTASGLKYIDAVVGTGELPRADQSVTVNYTGRLASDGEVFDSTDGRGAATFALARVIPGFSEGILTMRPGGLRTIYIPAALAYGANPPPGSGIQTNADLIFEIELISVR